MSTLERIKEAENLGKEILIRSKSTKETGVCGTSVLNENLINVFYGNDSGCDDKLEITEEEFDAEFEILRVYYAGEC